MSDDENARARSAVAVANAAEMAAAKAIAAARAAAAAAMAAGEAAAEAAKAAAMAAELAESYSRIAAATEDWNLAIAAANENVIRECREAEDEFDCECDRLATHDRDEAFRQAMEEIHNVLGGRLAAAWADWRAAKYAADNAFSSLTGGLSPPSRHSGWGPPGYDSPDTRKQPRP